MYAQALRTPPRLRRGREIQSSAYEQCAKGCAFSDVQLDCIKYLKLGDPACGTSGFLVAASEYLKENRKEDVFFNRQNKDHYMNHMFHGFDMDRTMLRIGAMNMMTHGVDNPFIEYRDSLSDQNPDREKYSLVLANPPVKPHTTEVACFLLPALQRVPL